MMNTGRLLYLPVLLMGCLRVAVPKEPVPVAIVAPIEGLRLEKPHCDLADMPVPPVMPEIDHEVEDVIRRVFVHIVQYQEMVQYAHDVQVWMGTVATCLSKLTDSPLDNP